VRREARTGVVVDGLQEVAHQAAGAVGDGADRVAGGAQHRIADDADRSDGHACSSCSVDGAGLSAPRISWVTSSPGTMLRSTVQPAATARENTFTRVAIS